MVVHPVAPQKNFDNCLKVKKFNLYPDGGYFGRYFTKPRCEKPVKKWLLCVARENIRLKNCDIFTKIWLSAPKITKTRKLKTCFPSIVSIYVHTSNKNKQKLTKTVMLSSLYIRDQNPPPPPLDLFNLSCSTSRNPDSILL